MAVITHDKLAHSMYANAKRIIEEGREAIPMLGLVAGDNITYVGMPWSGPVEKAMAIDAVRAVLAAKPEIHTYCLLVEAWVSKGKKSDPMDVMPRDDPKREEVLMVTAYARDGKNTLLVAEIKTLPDKKRRVMLPEEMDYDAMYGQLINLFQPEEAVN